MAEAPGRLHRQHLVDCRAQCARRRRRLYGSAKAFVSNVTRMAKELIGFGIRVNAVAPGTIATPFHERYSTEEQMKGMVATIPQGRAGTAQAASAPICSYPPIC
jgi:NAD(P)-dependent dehydrogenase (short-subunit alcohol dehydrogenase family)